MEPNYNETLRVIENAKTVLELEAWDSLIEYRYQTGGITQIHRNNLREQVNRRLLELLVVER